MQLFKSCLAGLIFVFGLCAQSAGSGTLTGKVTAPDGAAVPSASVVVTDHAGKTRSAVSGQDGVFNVTSLPEGTYQVEIAVAGYRKLSRPNVQVTDGSPLNIQFGLQREPKSRFGRFFGRKASTDSASEKK